MSKKGCIVFDLDGTLIDASDRLYELFRQIVPDSNLTKSEYWDLKRSGYSHFELVKKYAPKLPFDAFQERWSKEIESSKFLGKDKLYLRAREVLEYLDKKNDIYLWTARNSKTNLMIQLKELQILGFFSDVYITEGETDKKELYKKIPTEQYDSVILISDTPSDLHIGKNNLCFTIGCTYGFASKEAIETSDPDYIASEIIDIKQICDHKSILV